MAVYDSRQDSFSKNINLFDFSQVMGGWFRIGNRPNEGYAEMTCCLYLPDRSVGFMYGRPQISNNEALDAGGMRFEIVEPFKHLRLTYDHEAGAYRAHDADSLNGTRLNGRHLGRTGAPLQIGDRLRLGRLELTVEAQTPPGSAPARAAPLASSQETSRRLEHILASPAPPLRERLLRSARRDHLLGLPAWLATSSDLLVLLCGLAAAGLLAWVLLQ